MNTLLLTIGLALLLLALIIYLLLRNEQRYRKRRLDVNRLHELGLPEGKLVYGDADGQGDLFFSQQYPLVGKPDYVVELDDGRWVPIELKLSVHDVTEPYKNHSVQLGAYCLILEDYAKQPPTHGILRYADRDFIVDYTPALRRKVIRLIDEMGHYNEQLRPPLQKQRAARCHTCAFQPICPVGRGK